MRKTESLSSRYILSSLEEICLNGDAYVSEDRLYKHCRNQRSALTERAFKEDLTEQIRLGFIHREGIRLYAAKTWRYEESAARSLSVILQRPSLPLIETPCAASVNGLVLCEEQREAVNLAVSSRLSMILGGAGSGKSTLIRAIVNAVGAEHPVLCAPTGKAARNLEKRTGLAARTVHSALGMHPDEDFLSPVIWSTTKLVIVDEASMMTLEMLAGILHRVPASCRVVLLGDPNQLLSVGSGNVLPDLLTLGVPCARLMRNHRQDENAMALLHNVVGFSKLRRGHELVMDESFTLREMEEMDIQKALTEEAIRRYLAGESVQVLSPYNRAGKLSARTLNRMIRDRVNPLESGKLVLTAERRESFRNGDRVMILKNDRDRNCSNGDVGILHIQSTEPENIAFCVELPDGRCPAWEDIGDLELLSLAYVLTVHKAQGSEYDTILFPVSMGMYGMLSRNLFYTAISRAKKNVILFGSPQAVDLAMQKSLSARKSMLVAKSHMLLQRCA